MSKQILCLYKSCIRLKNSSLCYDCAIIISFVYFILIFIINIYIYIYIAEEASLSITKEEEISEEGSF